MTWAQMEERDRSRSEAIYWSVCRECGLAPSPETFAKIQANLADDLLTRSAKALLLDRSALEQWAAVGRIWWRSLPAGQVQVSGDREHWHTLPERRAA